MVNVEQVSDNQLPMKLVPDGLYIPRILFFGPDGQLLRKIFNEDPENDADSKYHYWTIPQIIDSMIKVLKMFPQAVNIECFTDNLPSITTFTK